MIDARASSPILLREFTAVSALGRGRAATLATLASARCPLQPCRFADAELELFVGQVDGLEALELPARLRAFECRNNRLALLGLRQDGFDAAVRERLVHWGSRRIGVFIGTSTSGVLHTELAYRRRDAGTGALPPGLDYQHTHNSYSVADFVRSALCIQGPAAAICTACSSSAKAFVAGARLLRAGVIDAALVGGVDSLCLTTLYGFHSLQLTSRTPCRPFDAERDGLSIGEGAAFALLERAPEHLPADALLLLGAGESSDAHHMSSPHPQGAGARAAMQAALTAAQLPAMQIDYINLHGTGTASNDAAEAQAVLALFGEHTPCSSTKGASAHTLGAAGALEAVVCALALQAGLMPGGLNTRRLDPALTVNYLTTNRYATPGAIAHVLSNSFGFGGANCALLFGRAA